MVWLNNKHEMLHAVLEEIDDTYDIIIGSERGWVGCQ